MIVFLLSVNLKASGIVVLQMVISQTNVEMFSKLERRFHD